MSAERKIHRGLKKISENVAEIAHYGKKNFVFENLLAKSEIDFKSLLHDAVTAMLRERDDIQMAESQSVDMGFQPDMKAETDLVKMKEISDTEDLSEESEMNITMWKVKFLRKFSLFLLSERTGDAL